MDESALWGKLPQGKSAVPLWYTTRICPLWETQRAGRSLEMDKLFKGWAFWFFTNTDEGVGGSQAGGVGSFLVLSDEI